MIGNLLKKIVGTKNEREIKRIQPLIEEAGGVFTDWAARRTAFGGSTIATNRALSGEVRSILAASPA